MKQNKTQMKSGKHINNSSIHTKIINQSINQTNKQTNKQNKTKQKETKQSKTKQNHNIFLSIHTKIIKCNIFGS